MKTRNFVAKNSPTAGSGYHKDRKYADKIGEDKHKENFMLTYEIPEEEIYIGRTKASELFTENQQLREENKVLKVELERLRWMLRTQD